MHFLCIFERILTDMFSGLMKELSNIEELQKLLNLEIPLNTCRQTYRQSWVRVVYRVTSQLKYLICLSQYTGCFHWSVLENFYIKNWWLIGWFNEWIPRIFKYIPLNKLVFCLVQMAPKTGIHLRNGRNVTITSFSPAFRWGKIWMAL